LPLDKRQGQAHGFDLRQLQRKLFRDVQGRIINPRRSHRVSAGAHCSSGCQPFGSLQIRHRRSADKAYRRLISQPENQSQYRTKQEQKQEKITTLAEKPVIAKTYAVVLHSPRIDRN